MKKKGWDVQKLGALRDSVEGSAIAILVALVLITFMVQAFVIPTGSMAPRLLGEHMSLTCPACGYNYAFEFRLARDASGAIPEQGMSAPRGQAFTLRQLGALAVCPNCNYDYPRDEKLYVDGGDGVLIMKYLYHFAEPQPWDVVVFKNPMNNRDNYIKRLIGLPGETIEIVHGDVFVKTQGNDWQIRRKPHNVQEAMWQVVYDNDFQVDKQMFNGDQQATRSWSAGEKSWDLSGDFGRRFRFAGSAAPAEVIFNPGNSSFLPHYGYNPADTELDRTIRNVDECNDLKLAAVFTPMAVDSAVALSLTSMEHHWQAEISANGSAVLKYSGPASGGQWQDWGRTTLPGPLKTGGEHSLALECVDFSVSLWVDGKKVLDVTDRYPESYRSLKPRVMQALSGQGSIPAPHVKLLAWGGASELTHISVMRDVYYLMMNLMPTPLFAGPFGEYARNDLKIRQGPGWGTTGNPIHLEKRENRDLDEFFMLGDNSPASLDGRGWVEAAPSLRLKDEKGQPIYHLGTVPRYNLIGKAFVVYWPARFRVPGVPSFAYLPNVGKMRMIH